VDVWVLVRFVHVAGAALWLGGQLTLTFAVVPLAGRLLPTEDRGRVVHAVGSRFARITLAGFLPLQVGTGIALAGRHGVTLDSLAEPGYGRTLAAKLALFTVAMLASAGHGIAAARRHTQLSRALGLFGLACSAGVVLLATALVGG
jgi:uncharacterized membrane protein